MNFSSEETPLGEGSFDKIYPQLVHDIIEHIDNIKKTDKSISLLDIIIDFSFKRDISVECIGDAISEDVYFKSFIEKDFEMHYSPKAQW